MKCPRCNNELRRSKKDPDYGLCDNCKKKYKLKVEIDNNKPRNSSPLTGCLSLFVILAILIAIVVLAFNSCSDNDSNSGKNVKQSEDEKDANGWTSDDYINFRVITKQTADEYIANYSTPWGDDDWTFVKFDDSGKVLVTTKFTFKNSNVKQTGVCIFTPSGDRFTSHFFQVGDSVYLNDGSCNDTINKINEILNQ